MRRPDDETYREAGPYWRNPGYPFYGGYPVFIPRRPENEEDESEQVIEYYVPLCCENCVGRVTEYLIELPGTKLLKFYAHVYMHTISPRPSTTKNNQNSIFKNILSTTVLPFLTCKVQKLSTNITLFCKLLQFCLDSELTSKSSWLQA